MSGRREISSVAQPLFTSIFSDLLFAFQIITSVIEYYLIYDAQYNNTIIIVYSNATLMDFASVDGALVCGSTDGGSVVRRFVNGIVDYETSV